MSKHCEIIKIVLDLHELVSVSVVTHTRAIKRKYFSREENLLLPNLKSQRVIGTEIAARREFYEN